MAAWKTKPALIPVLAAGLIVLAAVLGPGLGLVGSAQAEEVWVDSLKITIRRGPGTDFKISNFLRAGQAVELLSERDGWSEVRLADGEVGWVLTRFLTSRPSLASRAEELTATRQALRAEVKRLRELNRRLARRSAASALDPPPAELSRALALARRLIAKERERLESLKRETISSAGLTTWFFIGAGASALGMILGFAAGQIRLRRTFKKRLL